MKQDVTVSIMLHTKNTHINTLSGEDRTALTSGISVDWMWHTGEIQYVRNFLNIFFIMTSSKSYDTFIDGKKLKAVLFWVWSTWCSGHRFVKHRIDPRADRENEPRETASFLSITLKHVASSCRPISHTRQKQSTQKQPAIC